MAVSNGAYTRTQLGPEDDRLIPRFFTKSVQDEIASERAGRPIFRDREEVELLIPGNPYNIPCYVVTNEHRNRWPKQYETFLAGKEMAKEGTPLEEWKSISRAQMMEMKSLNIFTVEQAANIDDNACQRIGMGGRRIRELAKAFLDEAEAEAIVSRAMADSERKDLEIASLNHKVEELSELLNRLHGQMQDLRNAPSALATHIPGMGDPVEMAKRNPVPDDTSALDSIGQRRRGRPPLPRDAQGNPVRESA
jgi:hypothetical protein